MNKLISDIHNGVQNSRKTIEFLTKNSKYTWIANYPIAIVNEITRVKDEANLKNLESINFFDAKGFSKTTHTKEEIAYLQNNVPSAIKSVYCLCLKNKQNFDYTFKEKFEHDQWKKVQDEDNFEAFLQASKFTHTDTSKMIETEVRDIMRSAKEIPSLKAIGFVWIVSIPNTIQIEDILNLYFSDNHIFVPQGRKTTHIAWADRLAGINMRNFVNTP